MILLNLPGCVIILNLSEQSPTAFLSIKFHLANLRNRIFQSNFYLNSFWANNCISEIIEIY